MRHKTRRIFYIFCWLILFSVKSLAFATNISAINTKVISPKTTHIILTLSDDANFRHFILQNPERLAIDFTSAKLAVNLDTIKLDNTPIQKVRSGMPSSAVFRLVFDLKHPIKTKIISYTTTPDFKKQLVVEINLKETSPGNLSSQSKPLRSETKKAVIKSAPSRIDIQPVDPIPTKMDVPSKNSGREVIVLIDAGHGGKDPGAIGSNGVQEKEVVLGIAKELQQLISRQPGMRAVMTREGNYYVTLRERLQKARKTKADIFVAVHADAYKHAHSSGASVFALSLKGASSEAARWLAEKENYSELGDVDLDGKNDLLRSVLIDLSQTATISASLDLGDFVLMEMAKVGKLHYRKVEQAPFVVLKSPDIPSILVETGFLSNPLEEKKLSDKYHQKQIAYAIMKGIRDYFYAKPPPGTWIAHHKPTFRQYVIAEGDSLTAIAERFRVSVNTIKETNQLSGYHIEVGQHLRIPTSVG